MFCLEAKKTPLAREEEKEFGLVSLEKIVLKEGGKKYANALWLMTKDCYPEKRAKLTVYTKWRAASHAERR